tara:strand:- start:3051 stop:4163 length:1113 start_codon:yes stop_codon:yes gene_type:complete
MPIFFFIVSVISSIIYFIIIISLLVGLIKKTSEISSQKYKVSVVVSAHNESNNIANCLDDLLKQKYDKNLIEIIVVNDRSKDDTGDILNRYVSKHKIIKTLTIKDSDYSLSPKKYALSKAIDISNGEIILSTDADCRLNKLWISSMVSCFTPEVGAVAGLVILNPTNWIFSYLMTIDAIMNNLIIHGTLGLGFAVACKGGNFAYRRCVFEEVGGFRGLDRSLSGDDDLFIQKISSKSNWKIRSCVIKSSLVESSAPGNLIHYLNQRKRHISASKYFKKIVQFAYLIYFFSKIFMLNSFLYILYYNGFDNAMIQLMLSLYVATLILLIYSSKNNIQKKYLILYPIWEIYYVINHIVIGPFALLGKVKWGKR